MDHRVGHVARVDGNGDARRGLDWPASHEPGRGYPSQTGITRVDGDGDRIGCVSTRA